MNHMNISQLNIRGIYKVPKVPKVLRIVPVRSREREIWGPEGPEIQTSFFKKIHSYTYKVLKVTRIAPAFQQDLERYI